MDQVWIKAICLQYGEILGRWNCGLFGFTFESEVFSVNYKSIGTWIAVRIT